MSIREAEFWRQGVCDPRLAIYATSVLPAWLWSTDGQRILWCNPAGAAVFGASAGSALAGKAFGPADQHRRQVIRLSSTLPANGATRLQRLRGFGAQLGLLLTCACARLPFTDGRAGILITAIDGIGRAISYDDRVQRLIDDYDEPVAAFSSEGRLIGINKNAALIVAARPPTDVFDLAALGFETAALIASSDRRTEASRPMGHIVVQRVGQGADTALLAFITPPIVTAPIVPISAATPTSASTVEAAPVSTPQDLDRDLVQDFDQDLDSVQDFDSVQDLASALDGVTDQSVQHDEPLMIAVDDEPLPNSDAADTHSEDIAATPDVQTEDPPTEAITPVADPASAPKTRRHPLRFMWQMDAEGRFSLGANEFSRLIGPRTAMVFGRPWSEIVDLFNIDPDNRVANAVATRHTWSRIMVNWPTDGNGSGIPVELSGLPVYDKARQFLGYRGFGVCRDLEGLAQLALERQNDALYPSTSAQDNSAQDLAQDLAADAFRESKPTTDTSLPISFEIEPVSQPTTTDAPVDTPQNVVPLRPGDSKTPALTPVENNVFNELARQLASRLEAEHRNGETSAELATTNVKTPSHDTEPPPTATSVEANTEELGAILDALEDSILVFDATGQIIGCNRAAEVVFGYGERDLVQHKLTDLFAVEDRHDLLNDLESLKADPARRQNRKAQGLSHHGEVFALSLTLGRTIEGRDRFFAIGRKLPQLHDRDQDLREKDLREKDLESKQLKRRAERAASARSDILAKISHEVRTPLSTIIGFSDVIIEERFGAIENDRYASYMKDIRAAGERVLAIINDLLDLSRVETGKLDLTFAQQDLNDTVEKCVAAMQSQANRERIIIRTSLAHALPHVAADAVTLRQIVMNLVSNSIHIAKAGGQVIVSTAVNDLGDIVLRVRDTGRGLSHSEMEAALEQFRNPAAESFLQDNAGINLSLTKALVEANQAQLHIKSAPHMGTLVEVAFAQQTAKAV
jgi:PAS domain S-box-containing protein